MGIQGAFSGKGKFPLLSGARRGIPDRLMLREWWDWGLGPDFLPLGPELHPLITKPFPVLRLMEH